ncbi:MAG TPA: hypothetical protein VFQ43_19970 [Nitrososphaera sp.]|nr:hypothetical protein [Nitrososphaera sp.]
MALSSELLEFLRRLERLANRQPNTPIQEHTPSEYELAIDTQTEKFLETKQKLVYFIVTASIAPLAFSLSFSADKVKAITESWFLIFAGLLGALSGLLSAGSALFAIHCDLHSYRRHIATRYARKSWSELSEQEQAEWNKVNALGADSLRLSLFMLFIEIALLAGFLVGVLLIQNREPQPLFEFHYLRTRVGGSSMHHYGEDFTTALVDETTRQFTIILRNHVSGAELKLSGPLDGVFEDKSKSMDQVRADDLGRNLAHFLRGALL